MNDCQIPYITRSVPLSFRLLAIFGNVVGQMGWFFLCVGLVASWVIVPEADLSSLQYRGAVSTSRGRILSIKRTSFGEDDQPLYACNYEYTDQSGIAHKGTSYCKEPPSAGSNVTVESPVGRPGISRVWGMRSAPFPPWVIFVLIFPLAGALMAGLGIRIGIYYVYLFKNGRVARAWFKSIEQVDTRRGDKPLYNAIFEFNTDDGSRCETPVETTNPEEMNNDSVEMLLYDPVRPSSSFAVEELPGRPVLDGASNLCFRWSLPLKGLASMILPVLTFLICRGIVHAIFCR